MKIAYSLDQKVPAHKAVLLGLQWAALAVSSIVILGKVIGDFHFADPVAQIAYLQKMLFVSGLTLFAQVLWGHRLPLISGPATVLLVGVLASRPAMIDTVYTSVMVGGLCVAGLAASGLLPHVRKLFTLRVVAVVLLLIAFVLGPAILDLLIGGSRQGPLVGTLLFAILFTLALFGAQRLLRGMWQSTLIIWALAGGSAVHALCFPATGGRVPFSGAAWGALFFRDFTSSLSFQPGVLVAFLFCYVALSVNDLGSIQSVNELLAPPKPQRRLVRGVAVTGLGNVLSGLLGVIGPVNYSISPGVILSTGCASRLPLLPAAGFIGALSFFPAAIGLMSRIPSVVVGCVLIYIMASQIAGGLMLAFEDARERGFSFEDGLIIGLPVLVGTLFAFLPAPVAAGLPSTLRPLLGNGFVMGVAAAFVMEHVIFRRSRGS